MSELTEVLQRIAWAVSLTGVTVSLHVGLMQKDLGKLGRYPWATVRPLVVTFALAWLWFPWLGYGVYCVARWSTNRIDYCERPDNVIPADPKTIDLRKVEH